MVEKTLEQKQHAFDVDKTLEVLLRGCEDINKDFIEIIEKKVKEAADEGRILNIKFGMDPTSPELHLGHAVALRKLKQLQDLGHNVTIIIGDFTATIGDPTGRNKVRKALDPDEVENNAKTYLKQVYKILDENKTSIRYNSKWYDQIDGEEFIDLLSHFTINNMLGRRTAITRIGAKQDLHCNELIYPLLQGLDSVMVRSDIEMGGHDQLFNVFFGSSVQKMFGQSEQVGLFVPILTGIDGKLKMSKSFGNHIGITEDTRVAFKKIMDLRDDLVIDYFKLATDVPLERVSEYEEKLKTNPLEVKMELAKSILYLYHPKEEVDEASKSYKDVTYSINSTNKTSNNSDEQPPIELPLSKVKGFIPFVPRIDTKQLSKYFGILHLGKKNGNSSKNSFAKMINRSKLEKADSFGLKKKFNESEADKLLDVIFEGIKYEPEIRQEMKKKILSCKNGIRFKFSINPTSYGTNLSHLYALRKMRKLQDVGCGIDLVVEDYAIIFGRNQENNLDTKEIDDRTKECLRQIYRILERKKTREFYSSSWFKGFSSRSIVQLLSCARINDLLKKNSSKTEADQTLEDNPKTEEGLCCDQLVYPLLKALDSIATGSNFEIIETKDEIKADPNMTQYVQKACGYDPRSLVYIPKMGVYDRKSDVDCIINSSVESDFERIMLLPDDKIIDCFKQVTDLSIDEISKYEQEMKAGRNPRDVKMDLAKTVLSQFYSAEAVETSKKRFMSKTQIKYINVDLLREIIIDPEPSKFGDGYGISTVKMMKMIDPSQPGNAIRQLINGGKVFITFFNDQNQRIGDDVKIESPWIGVDKLNISSTSPYNRVVMVGKKSKAKLLLRDRA